MGAQENSRPMAAGKGSLDGLARRLGALEESLTVVAGELGVSGTPLFKHLDPNAVYGEAVRRAQDSVEPLRAALAALEARLAELATAQAELRREIADIARRQIGPDKIEAQDNRLTALAARLDATLLPFGRSDEKLGELYSQIERLGVRLDTLWQRLDAETRAQNERKPQDSAEAALSQRLVALELRLEKIANSVAANTLVPTASKTEDIEPRLAALRSELRALLEESLAAREKPEPQPANLAETIAAEVARQIAASREVGAQPALTAPLLSDTPVDKALEANPLVMSAAERAIVRLTHRLEKLEQANGDDGGGRKSSRLRKSRWFES
jgi:chromosome segregation ATPase